MKEAIGGTWIFGLVIFFIAFFTAFISISLNYSKCYKLKDEIIATIQRNNGVSDATLREINRYMGSIGYRSTGNCLSKTKAEACLSGFNYATNSDTIVPTSNLEHANYCIAKRKSPPSPDGFDTAYYYVKVFFKFDLPLIRNIFGLSIDGESATLIAARDEDYAFGDGC